MNSSDSSYDEMPTANDLRQKILEMTDEQLARVRLFITALRSDNFTQGRGRLTFLEDAKANDCCLGVACKVAVGNGVPLMITADPEESNFGIVRYGRGGEWEISLLPTVVRDWFGFGSVSPRVFIGDGDDYPMELTRLNDDRGYTFAMIADVVEATYITPNLGRDKIQEVPGQLSIDGEGTDDGE